ncbi:MAG: Ku protein, partial [Syntrophomonadaceae bacterium]|nr:Ku protein [Syntrophomonadaceae bacterium]
WPHQLRPASELELPAAGESGLDDRELSIARQLVEAMAEEWNPDKYKDSFTDKVMALVQEKVKLGRIETVVSPEVEAGTAGAEVIDLTDLLRRSLQRKISDRKGKPSGAENGRTADKAR